MVDGLSRTGIQTFLGEYRQALTKSVRPVLRLRSHRLWEVDVLRGVAILMMVVYHLVWDLWGLAGWPIDMYGPFWVAWQRITASLFIGLVGVSLHLRYQRGLATGRPAKRAVLTRALVLFTWALVISVVTYVYAPAMYIRFGILHFIATAMLLAYPLVAHFWPALVLGMGLLLLPRFPWRHPIPWLDWLGMAETVRPALDYFPLVPWLGLVLLGIALGHLTFPRGHRRWALPPRPPASLRWIAVAGQNSLLLYLIHQPVLITLLILAGIIPFM